MEPAISFFIVLLNLGWLIGSWYAFADYQEIAKSSAAFHDADRWRRRVAWFTFSTTGIIVVASLIAMIVFLF